MTWNGGMAKKEHTFYKKKQKPLRRDFISVKPILQNTNLLKT